jgi:hypothetical protein
MTCTSGCNYSLIYSWWWMEKASETCRGILQWNKINSACCCISLGFYNIILCCSWAAKRHHQRRPDANMSYLFWTHPGLRGPSYVTYWLNNEVKFGTVYSRIYFHSKFSLWHGKNANKLVTIYAVKQEDITVLLSCKNKLFIDEKWNIVCTRGNKLHKTR